MEQEIIRNYLRLRSPFKVANKLGLDIQTVLDVVNSHPELLNPRPSSVYAERHGGKGRPELREFVVARKKPTEPWDPGDISIAAARLDYEAGTIEMATGRDGDWLILYAIPRVKIQPRPKFFHAV